MKKNIFLVNIHVAIQAGNETEAMEEISFMLNDNLINKNFLLLDWEYPNGDDSIKDIGLVSESTYKVEGEVFRMQAKPSKINQL